MSEPEEIELLDRCRRGDPDAWDRLFDLHYAASGRYVFQLSPDLSREDVEEICQEAFISVVQSLGSFRGGSRFQTWLFRIAGNKARDHLAKRQAAKRGGGQVPVSLDAEHPETGLKPDLPDGLPDPGTQLEGAEQGRLVVEALAQLADPCREIIELRYFGDLSYEEISLTLDLNPKTVSSRLSKCLDKLEVLSKDLFSRAMNPSLPSNT